MNPSIKRSYLQGRLYLLLGAGASYGSKSADGVDLPMGDQLSKELASLMGWDYKYEPLSKVYSAVNRINSARLHDFFKRRLTNTKPSQELLVLTSYPWARIYTLNIDDCTETALRKNRVQELEIYHQNSPLSDVDPVYKSVQLIKLNGSADLPNDGFVFSPQEYGEGSTRLPAWYRELGNDYSSYSFLFIGSKLDEPLFQHAIAEMRSVIKRQPIKGYVITPTATEIDKHHLDSLNLEHIPGTLKDFTDWLVAEIPDRPNGWDIATERRPELRNIHGGLTDKQKRALNSITLVSPESIPKQVKQKTDGSIRNFYKGYKPQWSDITDEVHANVSTIKEFSKIIEESHKKNKVIIISGPAGSGKSTTLMASALRLSKNSSDPVYFLREAVSDIKEVVIALEQINSGPFYLFIDKIESMHNEVFELISSGKTKNICIIASERLNIWNRRVKSVLSPVLYRAYLVDKIRKQDANLILEKLKIFGPWTRLQSMSPEDRLREIFNKSDRQLLIGLMEATTGLGFSKIIDRDFKNIGDDAHKNFLVLIGLASIHRSTLSTHIISSALRNLDILEDINVLATETEGVVSGNSKRYSARHPVYVRELFEKIVPVEMIRDCIVAALEAFSDYESPVIKNVSKPDGVVFRSIINHRFIKEMMRNDAKKVFSIYESFETRFHIDGLYWLQYGLALRGFNRQEEALDKLKTARQAYDSPQIEHAYAQQLMVICSRHDSWGNAEPFLNEAILILRKLNKNANGSDTYPIVTLAEGHITVVLRFLGVEGAKPIAQQYANELLALSKNYSTTRLDGAVNKVVTFATTGIWDESYGPDYSQETD